MRTLALALLLAASSLAACSPYDPNLGDRPFKCGVNDPQCPDGYSCQGTGSNAVCVSDNLGDAGTHPDASHVKCGTDTSLEPNDDIQHAVQTPVRNSQTDYKLAQLAICPSTDIDIYGFTTTALGQNVRITLTYDPTQGALKMLLLNAQGVMVDTAKVDGNNLVIAIPPDLSSLSVDQWYVQVAASAANVENNYDLDISVTP
jgi:hypothetical protein